MRLGALLAYVIGVSEDVLSAFVPRKILLPPARLRMNVSGSGSRREFASAGERGARIVSEAIPASGSTTPVLDFACGPGRIAMPLQRLRADIELSGVDVDRKAIAWCRARLPGTFQRIQPAGTLPFRDGGFRAVYAFNVFTHFDEEEQAHWLREIHRVLCSGGTFVVTTRPTELLGTVAALTETERASLRGRGFAFLVAPAASHFNDRLAFLSADYMRQAWAPWFRMTEYHSDAFLSRDVAVFTRNDGSEHSS